MDTSVLEQSRKEILQILNTGSLKDLKGLQQIGDKKAKLILGWRVIHGHFTKVSRERIELRPCGCISSQKNALSSLSVQIIIYSFVCFFFLQLEDLGKVEGMTEKRFLSFMKVSKGFSLIFLPQSVLAVVLSAVLINHIGTGSVPTMSCTLVNVIKMDYHKCSCSK